MISLIMPNIYTNRNQASFNRRPNNAEVFPSGHAVDETFRNREEERGSLKASIDAHEHI